MQYTHVGSIREGIVGTDTRQEGRDEDGLFSR